MKKEYFRIAGRRHLLSGKRQRGGEQRPDHRRLNAVKHRKIPGIFQKKLVFWIFIC